jgi:hypothetical protein
MFLRCTVVRIRFLPATQFCTAYRTRPLLYPACYCYTTNTPASLYLNGDAADANFSQIRLIADVNISIESAAAAAV